MGRICRKKKRTLRLPHFADYLEDVPPECRPVTKQDVPLPCGCPSGTEIAQNCRCSTWSCPSGHEWVFHASRVHMVGFVRSGTTVMGHDGACELYGGKPRRVLRAELNTLDTYATESVIS